MGFDATISFTGACGIVPRKNYPDPPEAFCVLLPDAWNDNPYPAHPRLSSVDGGVLQRHCSYMYYTTEHAPGTSINKGSAGIWYFDGHRLLVTPQFVGAEQPAAWDPNQGGINGLASFEDISSPGLTDQYLNVSRAVMNPQKGRVTGQVLLKNGVLSAPSLAQVWVFDSYLLSGDDAKNTPRTRALNYRVVVSLQNITHLQITARALYAISPDRVFNFDQGPLEITIANLCEQNPLRWGNETAGSGLKDDDDFRWHYELVDDPAKLKDALDPCRCPIPRLALGDGAGGGLNCFPKRFPAVDFAF